jgi:hypothetical protein
MTKTRDLADLGGGFIQVGTGAVQRTVESKLQETVSVKDFGAVGNGTVDDRAAIQKAIDTGKQVYLPKGNYLIKGTLKVSNSSVVLRGDGRGQTVIIADTTFVGTGDSITNTMIQFNSYPATGKLFFCGLKDLSISSATPSLQNPAVECLVFANWMHHFNINRVEFYGAYGNGSNGTGLVLTCMANTGQEWAMYNTVADCAFTYCVNGIKFGRTGQGDINASQVINSRFGGGDYGGIGIKVESASYSNSFVNNDVEGFATAFDLNARVNFLRGNLAEQNTTDFTAAGTGIGPVLLGNELNIVSSESPGVHLNEHGTVSRLFLNSSATSLIVDGNFNSKLYESAFLGTSLVAAGATESGKYVLNVSSSTSITDKLRAVVNTKGSALNGWYTFVVRAKASATGAGLYLKLPAGSHTGYQFSEVKSGTTEYIELLEANSHTFVAGIGRSGALATTYRTYYGSVFLDNANIEANNLQLSVQSYGATVSVDYFGMFEGLNAARPSDSMTWETYKNVSSLTSGNGSTLIQLPYPTRVNVNISSYLDGNSISRAINYAPVVMANGGAAAWCQHYGFNAFGFDAAANTNTSDHLYLDGASSLQYFSRSNLAGTNPLYLRFTFF